MVALERREIRREIPARLDRGIFHTLPDFRLSRSVVKKKRNRWWWWEGGGGGGGDEQEKKSHKKKEKEKERTTFADPRPLLDCMRVHDWLRLCRRCIQAGHYPIITIKGKKRGGPRNGDGIDKKNILY